MVKLRVEKSGAVAGGCCSDDDDIELVRRLSPSSLSVMIVVAFSVNWQASRLIK